MPVRFSVLLHSTTFSKVGGILALFIDALSCPYTGIHKIISTSQARPGQMYLLDLTRQR